MNRKRRNLLLAIGGVMVVLVFATVAFRSTMVCCALPPLPAEYTASAIVALNKTIEADLHLTETAAWSGVIRDPGTFTHTPSPTNSFPYDATLYAQRRQEEMMLRTGAGPTQYAIFYATEAALIATYQGTVLPTVTPVTSPSPTTIPTPTPPPYDATLYAQRRVEEERIRTNTGPIYTAEYFYATETALVATYQGTATTPPVITPSRTPTPTSTLCPYSDVICPGGNETLSPAGQVMLLMASASAPEFGQLAQTATALYVTLTPSPTAVTKASNTPCAFMWAHQDLPDITKAAQEAFTEAKLDAITVIRADAYGESCGSSFGAMTTDFYLSAEVDDFGDTEAVGKIITDAYSVLMALEVELPAKHGYLDIEFTSDGETKRFRTMFSQIKLAVEAEASGEAIIEAGDGLW
ncbi:MAG: hypothetical protein LCI00_25830 [Chloroflexi bacterium]|nr:hypothetical protein [Chloroflexota bacterium]MCC6895356.1 hypothetical protein [Anaerolineae bacterium]